MSTICTATWHNHQHQFLHTSIYVQTSFCSSIYYGAKVMILYSQCSRTLSPCSLRVAPLHPMQTLPGVKPGNAIRGLSAGIGEGAGPSIDRCVELPASGSISSLGFDVMLSSGKSDPWKPTQKKYNARVISFSHLEPSSHDSRSRSFGLHGSFCHPLGSQWTTWRWTLGFAYVSPLWPLANSTVPHVHFWFSNCHR